MRQGITEGERLILSAVAQIADRLDRLEAGLALDPLLAAIANAFGRGVVFRAGEAWARYLELKTDQDQGGRADPLVPEMEAAGIDGTQALGQYLASFEGKGVNRVKRGNGGWIWAVV